MRRKRLAGVIMGLGLAGMLSACGTTSSVSAAKANGGHGLANVAYAGSLEEVNNLQMGPAFEKATGDRYQGQGGGSFGVAHEIASKTLAPNVFESIGYAPIQDIEPKFTRWALGFAASPLVVAYSPHTPYAAELTAIKDGKKPLKDLFALMAEPGFHLGRTNPNTDPQGQAFYMMVELAGKKYGLSQKAVSQILGPLDNSHEVYSEEGILSLLQAGGLDASSAFLSEALQRHLDYIALPASLNFAEPGESAQYASASLTLGNGHTIHGVPLTVDITTVGHPTPAALSFVQFVLSNKGRHIMKKEGYSVFTPELSGSRSAVPAGLKAEVR